MASTQRVFVALWPPPQVRAQLAAIADRLARVVPACRPMAAANLHLTLAFIGALEAERVEALCVRLNGWQQRPFFWRLDRFGVFARARVVWIGGEPNGPLDELVRAVRVSLDELQIRYDPKPFAAHVTLLRDAKHLPAGHLVDPPVDWLCDRPVLVLSTSGPKGPIYQPLATL